MGRFFLYLGFLIYLVKRVFIDYKICIEIMLFFWEIIEGKEILKIIV